MSAAAVRAELDQTDAPHLLESELVAIWYGQRFPREALRLADGSSLQVVYRGRPGRGPGPDFRDAVVALADGRLLHGDVELHVRASDFRRHGHNRDPAYNQVVLHVVFHHDGGATLLESGAEVLTLPLAPWVARRAGELESWLSQPALWEEPCRDAVPRLGPDEVQARLVRLGQRRLRQKGEALRRRIAAEGEDQAVYREIIEACGYGPNRHAFRRLAEATNWDAIAADAVNGLTAAAGSLQLSFERQTRPGATPEDRLRGAGLLLQSLCGRPMGLAAEVAALVRRSESGDRLLAALTVREDGRTLLGRGRAAELAVNVVLPAALCAAVAEATVQRLYNDIPDPGSYGLTAYLEGILRRQHNSLLKSAAERQGLLLLQKEYCSRGGCGSCPLSS